MSSVKTAVSIDESLFRKANELARKMKLSRSGFIANAVADYVRRLEAKDVLTQLNEVYADGPDGEDRKFLHFAARGLAKLTEGQW